MFSYDRKTQILYTCDAFGLHYCDDHTFDEEEPLKPISDITDCLMAPNARSVLSALKRMGELGNNYRRHRSRSPVAPQC